MSTSGKNEFHDMTFAKKTRLRIETTRLTLSVWTLQNFKLLEGLTCDETKTSKELVIFNFGK